MGILHGECLINFFGVDEFTGLPDLISDGFLKCPVYLMVSDVLSDIWKSVILMPAVPFLF